MNKILIHEVGLRDGLQMEKETVPTDIKIKWTDMLIESGCDIIQLGSFVHPKRMPQMADTDELFKYYNAPERKPKNVIFSGLALNDRGVQRALDCGTDMICIGVSASETHSNKNTGMSPQDAADKIIGIAKEAMDEGRIIQASVQSAFGCGFEGKIAEDQVFAIVDRYYQAGFRKVSMADTAGHAFPTQVKTMYTKLLAKYPDLEITSHFHNTFGLGIANCVAAIEAGAKCIETAFGGLGGCPFTKVSAGNITTEDLVHMFHRQGERKDINLDILMDVTKDVAKFFDRELNGHVYKTGKVNY